MNYTDSNQSIVYITGAGPGDPDLLTLKAREIIEKADVIAYDNLVSKEVLELALFLNQEVKLIYTGKNGFDHKNSMPQDQINNLLLKLSKEYKTICRLKGGDPNVFGRSGEETVFLANNNIKFEIVPGVSSITAVPVYAGIPITHRDFASSFTVLTAHEDPDNPTGHIKWENFDAINGTLILLMGVKKIPEIINKLINLGRKDDTPLAIIYRGTTSNQRTLITTLKNAEYDLKKNKIEAPSVIVVGEVVNLRKILNWYETKPLFGKRVLITREKNQASFMASKIIKSGAKPVNCPIVSYELIEKESYNKNIINNLSSFNWIFFTSQNAVKYFFEILNKNYYDSRALSNIQIGCVGYKTKLELEKYNIKANFIPKRFSLKDLISELNERIDLNDKKILLPIQVETLHATSLQNITEWPIYRANFIESLPYETINQIKEGIDVLTLFSSNTAIHFKKLIEKHNLEEYLKNVKIAVIGEETAKTTRQIFGNADIVAEPFTEEGLINAMEQFFVGATLAVTQKG